MNQSPLFGQWTEATAKAPWGVQAVMLDTLNLVAEGKVTLVYGANYQNGSPCLVNAVGQMLTAGASPSSFGAIVSLFDRINHYLFAKCVNTDRTVSPAAAEVLVHYFAPLKDKPVEVAPPLEKVVYVEPSDTDLAQEWLNALQKDAVNEICHAPLMDEPRGANEQELARKLPRES